MIYLPPWLRWEPGRLVPPKPKIEAHGQLRRPICNVTFAVTRDGQLVQEVEARNTVTNFLLDQATLWLTGALGGGYIAPTWFALGTGTGTTEPTDITMFAETPGTRLGYSSRSTAANPYIATIQTNYTGSFSGTFTEAAMWDANSGSTTLSANIAAGATALPVTTTTSPAVTVGEQLYISDGVNSEYVYVQTAEAAGAASWPITTGTQYAHSSGVTVYAFGGDLWAHVAGFSVQKLASDQLSITWQIEFAPPA